MTVLDEKTVKYKLAIGFLLVIVLFVSFGAISLWEVHTLGNLTKMIYEHPLVVSNELQEALSEIKTLSGLLPICASCKKIRDDTGYWNQIELYIRDHTEAEFSHSLCPNCAEKLYGDLLKEQN